MRCEFLRADFEKLRERQKSLIEEQKELGRQLGEVMGQSSETFHDNAPAEAIAQAANSVADKLSRLSTVLSNAALVEPLEHGDPRVAIGSLVKIRYENNDREEWIRVGSFELPELRPATGTSIEDPKIVSCASPIGRGVRGKEEGEEFFYIVQGKEVWASILEVHQPGAENQQKSLTEEEFANAAN